MKQFSLQPDPGAAPKKDLLTGLNEQQAQAVQHSDGPLLIVAGAGSGKTRVLTYRIAYLLQQHKAVPSQVLALTFTNKAAREMKERITNLIGDKASSLWMGTFHSIFSKILRFEADKIGFGKDFTIYDTSDVESMIKQILKELGFDPKEIRPRTIQFKISDAKNQLIDPDMFADRFANSMMDEIMSKVYGVYKERLAANNAMDFDDLLIKPIELFEKHPEVLENYQDRFKFIMIDEYQDTNHAQYKVTRLLAEKYQNICVVGDDAQSIYSFRGADISNILNFKNDYTDAVQVPLEQNYRSTQSILKVADSIIKKNEKQLEKTLWTSNNQGDPIIVLDNFDERDEANRVVSLIHELNLKEGYKHNEFAILYRTNYQSRVFEEALRRRDIPYQLIGGLSFYQRKEIKDVLAYLTLLVNPHDETNLLRIINEPSRGIGNKSLGQLIQTARKNRTSVWSLLEHIEDQDVYKPAKIRIREFVDVINSLRSELENGVAISEVVKHLLEKSGYVKMLVQEASHESLTRRDNIIEFQNAISYYEQTNANPSLSAFLQEITLITDGDKYDDKKPAVTLMTVHGSKGLEFPVVFIVGLEENLFPIGNRDNEETDIEEERRLFYVAITRAKEKLYFSHCRSRFKFGEEQRQLRSRFLDEVDPAFVRTETGATIFQKKDRFENKSGSGSSSNIEYDWQKPISSSANKSTGMTVEYDYDEGNDPFQVGARVFHDKFGEGKIVNRNGLGSNTRVVVFFKGKGQKTLMLRVARLKVLN